MTTTTTKESIEATAAQLGLTMTSEFVPFSKSRSAGEKTPSLNWKITLHKNGKPILTTDYGAGCGHCPSYKASVKVAGGRNSIMRDEMIRWECENGREAARIGETMGITWKNAKPILPEFADVLHSLASDSDVIDAGGFEEWAGNFGYDTDSRKAEGIYRACLEIALKLRAAIGDEGLATLREACQDY